MRFLDVVTERLEFRRGVAHRGEAVVVGACSQETDAQPPRIDADLVEERPRR